ncbi:MULTISPECIES: hypothetical protein [Brevibacillus]|uniref:hypothetical protein n=1 Tax=Brevibacillus TaxID=55080 RepID=UPI00046A894E|nr:hypothetical protein [Brevibacillus borstelensis]MCM3471745.1 hypothetical protein [Brevibacillus borstelensis]MCM3561981.1 hypothetical protein [Brevibacillus borstelensis]MCM3594104.1 hypothetical protein [Brevibacillus borstelensis]MCM3625280.1 hypothetical protein [Brevibacillus borstelensis]MED1855146.1 hypothetical protein [Brevibacillus borstelensis]
MKMKIKSFVGVIFSIALIIGIPTLVTKNSSVEATSLANSIPVVEEQVPDYPVNAEGQTYGHGPYPYGPTREPSLIRTIGENGVVGYVKAADLDSSASSPQEAIIYQESMKSVDYKSIPLYESDGKTKIGEFRFYYSGGD